MKNGIVIITKNFPPSYTGAGLMALELAKGLISRGVSVLVLAGNSHLTISHENYDGVRVTRLPLSGSKKKMIRLIIYHFNIAGILIKERVKYNSIIIFGKSCLPYVAIIIGKILGKKIVYRPTMYGADDLFSIRSTGRLRKLRYLTVSHSDYFVALSNATYKSILKCSIDKNRIREIPNGVNIEKFAPVDSRQKKILRNELNLPLESAIIFFAGAIRYRKGVDLLINAFITVNKYHQNINLLLAGPKKEEEIENRKFIQSIEKKIEQNNFNKKIRFLGFLDNIEKYYQSSDIFVLPSRQEGFPSSLIQAMSCGLSVITTDIAGITDEIIEHGKDGILIEQNNEKDLENALGMLINNTSKRRKIAIAARKKVEEHYSIDNMIDNYLKIYNN
jgi:glycosyltransferase involved in cell wall biosynthesis